ncbi:MAG: phosphatidylglycerophosphatase A family protein [Candidatus Binatia bacterium]
MTRGIILLLASGGGVGCSPYFPGTLGTLIAIPLSLGLNRLAATDASTAGVALVGLILIAIGLADQAARILGKKDPPIVVIDEIAGFALANFMTEGIAGLILAFVLFRFFDIAKVFPAAPLEALPGGAGIVLDDIMAGLYTFLVLRLLSSTSLI